MITNLFINIIVLVVGAIFSFLPQVTTLPAIGGYDIDGALVTGVAGMKTFFTAFWPLQIMFTGFLFLLGYYALKLALKFLLGHRSPGH